MSKTTIRNTLTQVNHILKNFLLFIQTPEWIKENKKNIIELTLSNRISETNFYKITSIISSQSRSVLWEKYFMLKHKYDVVGRKENRGDIKKNETYYEYKCSLHDQINFRLLQIRIWQNCDYIFQFITFEKVYTFKLTKIQMIEEMKVCGCNSAHGTVVANKHNKNIEKTMTIKKDSNNWKRWIEKYEH